MLTTAAKYHKNIWVQHRSNVSFSGAVTRDKILAAAGALFVIDYAPFPPPLKMAGKKANRLSCSLAKAAMHHTKSVHHSVLPQEVIP